MTTNHHKTAETIESLLKVDVFKSLDEDACSLISNLVKWRQYRQGTEIISYKDESDSVYFIASGSVRITIFSFYGKEISYQELGPGEVFGELSAIDHLPRTANVVTLETARIGTMSGSDFWGAINQYPSVAGAVLKRLASMVRFLADRVFQYGALDVKDRVRSEVLRLARDNMLSDDTASIHHFPTHSEIANRVNTHREAVTRELSELTRMGLIEQNKRVLSVIAVSRLTELLPEET